MTREDEKMAASRLSIRLCSALQLVAGKKKCVVMPTSYVALREKVRRVIKNDMSVGAAKAKRVDAGPT